MICGVVYMQSQADSCVLNVDHAAVCCSMCCRSKHPLDGREIQKAPNSYDEKGEAYHDANKEFFMLTGLAVKLNMEFMLDSVSVFECVWVGGFQMLLTCDRSSVCRWKPSTCDRCGKKCRRKTCLFIR